MYLSKLTISGFRQFGQGDAAAEMYVLSNSAQSVRPKDSNELLTAD